MRLTNYSNPTSALCVVASWTVTNTQQTEDKFLAHQLSEYLLNTQEMLAVAHRGFINVRRQQMGSQIPSNLARTGQKQESVFTV